MGYVFGSPHLGKLPSTSFWSSCLGRATGTCITAWPPENYIHSIETKDRGIEPSRAGCSVLAACWPWQFTVLASANSIYYSSFHCICHYPNITPIYYIATFYEFKPHTLLFWRAFSSSASKSMQLGSSTGSFKSSQTVLTAKSGYPPQTSME